MASAAAPGATKVPQPGLVPFARTRESPSAHNEIETLAWNGLLENSVLIDASAIALLETAKQVELN
jgi:hypothetical protein